MRALDLARVTAPDLPAGRPLTLDARLLAESGLWPPADAARRLGDEFRVVKRSLLSSLTARATPRRVVAVASALAGEGKTFSAFNLAMNLALERDTHVVLIDGDVARPTLTRVLGVEGKPGLLDVLERHDVALDEALYRTDVERLWFIGAGHSHASRAELLGGPRMGGLLDQLFLRLPPGLVVVIDTPPLLPTVESRAIVDAADLTLLVVRANSTPQAALVQALEQLGRDRPIQLMLNQRRETRLDQYYYYGYGSYGARAK
jgi:Mrp family chromosome partitioning ATPase